MKDIKYTLTINTEQANILIKALDLYSRIGMGQLGSLIDHPDLFSRMMTKDGWHIMTLGDKLEPVKQELFGLSKGCYHGIHSDQIDDSNRVAWDMLQVVRHRLAWDWAEHTGKTDGVERNWSTMMAVSYDKPMKSSDKVELATIERIDE